MKFVWTRRSSTRKVKSATGLIKPVRVKGGAVIRRNPLRPKKK